MNIAAYGAITTACYLIVEFVIKNTKINNKWYPAISGVLGIILGALCFYAVPEFPADNVFGAVITGAVSGLAATGTNQVYKQLHDGKEE